MSTYIHGNGNNQLDACIVSHDHNITLLKDKK